MWFRLNRSKAQDHSKSSFFWEKGNKKARNLAELFSGRYDTQLLELRFLINHMLASYRVVLGNFHLARARTLVFGRRIEVTRTSGRF